MSSTPVNGSISGSVSGSYPGSPVDGTVRQDHLPIHAIPEGTAQSTGDVDLENDTSMVDASSGVALPVLPATSVASHASEESLVSSNLALLRSEMKNYLEAFSHARSIGDNDAADEALTCIERTKRRIKAMHSYSSFVSGLGDVEVSSTPRSVGASAGLSLSHRDLPKFQLASSVVRPFPNSEVYESVEHFLQCFENIIEGSSYRDIEQVWKKFLPLCLPHSDNAWVATELKRCNSWSEAKAAFKEHHGSSLAISHYTDLVFTMKMTSKESISDYSKRFLQAVFNAGLPQDDPRIADRFLSSLVLPVQTLIRVTLARAGGLTQRNEIWTVEYITQVGRNVLGDDNALYAEAASIIPGVKSERREEGPGVRSMNMKKKFPFKNKSISRINKTYFCTQHGKNPTHDTKDCFSIKKRGEHMKSKGNKACYKCKKPWAPGHVCNDSHQVLAVSDPTEKQVAQPKVNLEKATAEIHDMMEELSYECKYTKNEKNRVDESKANAFKLLTPIIVENQHLVGCIDTGSSTSFINSSVLIKKLKINKINKVDGSYNFLSHNNEVSRIGITNPLQFKYANGIAFKHTFEVMKFNDGFDFDILLGTDILPKMNIGLTGVAYKPEGVTSHSDVEASFENINFDHTNEHEPDNSPAGTPEQRAEFFNLVKDSIERNQSISPSSSCPMPESIIRLPTKEGATSYRRQYPIPHALRPVLDRQITEWLETGTIIKSKVNTSFNHALLLVPKRDKLGQIASHRVVVDLRGLNNLLPPSFNFPVPLVREIFDNLAHKKVFTTLDLSNAYHRFKVAPEDVHKLTFTHNNSQYSFVKGCFGVKMLTSQFQKCLATLFDGVDCVQNFVDDCIIASDSIEQHAKDVKLVLDKLTSVNLILNPKKCSWFQHSVRLLGFVVNAKGTKVDRQKLTGGVDKWPIPKSSKQIQSFMGLINYFREYIPMISRVAEPISRLSHAANVEELWTDEQTRSFEALKKILQSNLILHYPDLSKEFHVATDASQFGVSAVLYQKEAKTGREQYVSFVSSSLQPSMRRWSTTKRELYGVVLALKKFRKFLWGRRFTVFTDHKALVYLHTQKVANPMMIGWIETLLDFDFDVVHIPGILNRLPDLLSRLYPPLEDAHKLVEDSSKNTQIKREKKKPNFKRVSVKRKRYSRDKVVNVLATKLIERKNDVTDYICPPEEERDSIMRETHAFGHFGYQAIVRDIHSRGMHWINIYDDAKNTVSSCPECQKHNITKRGYHPLTSVVAQRPFDHVAIDLAGPLAITEEGYMYLLVLTDICTKYIVIRPLKNKQSDTIAKTLIKIFGDYGWPRIMQSDNGTEFRNSLMHSLSKNLGIDRRFSTAYHPQGNGSAEASVKIAMNILRKMVQSNGRDWSHYLPIVQICMNRYIKNKTLSSPFSLMYARRVNLPDDYADLSKHPLPKDLMTVEELEERIKHMEELVFPAIFERTQKINEEYSKRYNKKNVLVDIPVGTHVMVRLKSRPSKLAPLYEGPYTVVRKNKGGSYELKDEQNELLHRNYTPSELKVVSLDESVIEDEYFEVEDIRDHRGSPGNREFLVKWAGYGERANTWQKASDFTAPTLVQRYWDKHAEQKKIENERTHKVSSAVSRNSKVKNQTLETENTKVQDMHNKRDLPSTKESREERLKRRRLNKE